MGQKIHPVGLRLGITRTWDSRWYEKKNYRAWLHEDAAIRKYFGRLTRAASISKVEIERRANQARIIVHTAKPGIIIGKRGVGIEDSHQFHVFAVHGIAQKPGDMPVNQACDRD